MIMNFIEIARSRYSCRNYNPEVITEEVFLRLMEAFRIAPSAVNFQPWHIIAVKKQENLVKVHEAYPRDWFRTAPMVLIVCGDHSKSWKRPSDGKDHADIDIAIAIDHLTLQATSMGLATCWVCNFKPEVIRQHFSLPENLEPIVLIPVGYPNDHPDIDRHVTKRKTLTEIVSWEKL